MRRSAALLIVMSLIVAACGGNPDNGQAENGSTGTTEQQGAAPADPDSPSDPVGDRSPIQSSGDYSGAVDWLFEEDHQFLVEEGETTWDVVYKPETVLVAGQAMNALISEDLASGVYIFDESRVQAEGIDLTEGLVLLLEGRALRRITGVQSGGGQTTVQTEQASLADVIEEGTVAWDVPLTFDFSHLVSGHPDSDPTLGSNNDHPVAGPQLVQIGMVMPDGRTILAQGDDDAGGATEPETPTTFPPTRDDDVAVWDRLGRDAPHGLEQFRIRTDGEEGSVEWEIRSGNWRYQFRLTPQGERLGLLIVASRSQGGRIAVGYRAEGTIGLFRTTSNNTYSNGELTDSGFTFRDIGADFELSASVAGGGLDPLSLKVPIPFIRWVVLVGPMPILIEAHIELIGNVRADANSSASARSSFSFRGDVGFNYEGRRVSANWEQRGEDIRPEPADSAGPMGMNVDAQFGVAFPKIRASIFNQGVVPEIQYGAVLGSSLRWGPPAAGFPASWLCKEAYVRHEAKGSITYRILGVNLGQMEHKFFEDRIDAVASECPED